jgi:hypothetical protein
MGVGAHQGGEWFAKGRRGFSAGHDRLAGLFEPDVLLPAQFFAAFRREGGLERERLLMLAVLEDAVDCYQKYAHARGSRVGSRCTTRPATGSSRRPRVAVLLEKSATPSRSTPSTCDAGSANGVRRIRTVADRGSSMTPEAEAQSTSEGQRRSLVPDTRRAPVRSRRGSVVTTISAVTWAVEFDEHHRLPRAEEELPSAEGWSRSSEDRRLDVRGGIPVTPVVPPHARGDQPIEENEHVDAHVGIVVLVDDDRRRRVRHVRRLQRPSSTPVSATMSETRAVRSIICRFAVVLRRNSAIVRSRSASIRPYVADRHDRRSEGLGRDPDRHAARILERPQDRLLVEPVGEAGAAEGRARLAILCGSLAVDVACASR